MNIFTEIKLAVLIQKYLSIYQKELKMTFNWHLFGQLCGTTIQLLNQFLPFVPDKMKPWIAWGVGLCQVSVGLAAHFYTPEGTLVPPPAK